MGQDLNSSGSRSNINRVIREDPLRMGLDEEDDEDQEGHSERKDFNDPNPDNQQFNQALRRTKSIQDLETLVLRIQSPKFLFGWNLVTGYSNFKTWVEVLAELFAVLAFLYILTIQSDWNKHYTAIVIIYILKWLLLLIDTINLIRTKVIRFCDIIFPLNSLIFWVIS